MSNLKNSVDSCPSRFIFRAMPSTTSDDRIKFKIVSFKLAHTHLPDQNLRRLVIDESEILTHLTDGQLAFIAFYGYINPEIKQEKIIKRYARAHKNEGTTNAMNKEEVAQYLQVVASRLQTLKAKPIASVSEDGSEDEDFCFGPAR